MEQTVLTMKSPANVNVTPERKIYTGYAAKVMNLLAAGVTETEAAKACGIDQSLVSQYKKEKDFMDQLHEKINIAMQDATHVDDNFNKIEKKLSDRLLSMADMMFHPDQVLRTLKFVNEAKRKTQPILPGAGTSEAAKLAPTILVLPTVVVKEFTVNPNNEVVGVGNKSLNTLNTTSLNELVKQRKREPVTVNGIVKKQNGSRQNEDPYSDL
jgi:predicted transcriptional regulator